MSVGPRPAAPPIWTRTFTLLCASQFLGSSHQGLLTPAIPLYVVSLGYSEAIAGLVLATFSTTSFLIRPLLGYLADRWSVRGVLGAGAVLLVIPSGLFVLPGIWLLAMANAIRGIGWSAYNTGGNTLLAHVAPPSRRGEAASYASIFGEGTLALASPLALWLVGAFAVPTNFHVVFVVAALAAAGVVATARAMPAESAGAARPAATAPAARGLDRFVDRAVLYPSLLLLCVMLTYPVMTSFVPLYARALGVGVEQIGWYYVAVGACIVIGRIALRRVSDTFGRGRALVVAFGCVVLAILLMAVARDLPLLIVGGVVYAFAQSLHQPATLALAIDRANPARRGAAMASYTLWIQVGIGVGSAIAGQLAAGPGYQAMYLTAAVPPLVGLAAVAANWRRLGRTTAA